MPPETVFSQYLCVLTEEFSQGLHFQFLHLTATLSTTHPPHICFPLTSDESILSSLHFIHFIAFYSKLYFSEGWLPSSGPLVTPHCETLVSFHNRHMCLGVLVNVPCLFFTFAQWNISQRLLVSVGYCP